MEDKVKKICKGKTKRNHMKILQVKKYKLKMGSPLISIPKCVGDSQRKLQVYGQLTVNP